MEKTFSLGELPAVAAWVWEQLGNRKVLALHGAMGAGKTTLVHALCEAKGVQDVVSSPTFSIINEYRSADEVIYHIDLYRLQDETEASRAGVEDCLCSGAICLVEWPERAPALFPDDTLHLWLETTGTETRRLQIRGID